MKRSRFSEAQSLVKLQAKACFDQLALTLSLV